MSVEPAVSTVLRERLQQLQVFIRDAILENRNKTDLASLSVVAHESTADTIYEIDKVSEAAISQWFREHWPADEPIRLVMEGIEDDDPEIYPPGTPIEQCQWCCILDPIDGTRSIMYDKRSAWILAAIAPDRGPMTGLQDIIVAVMTELPTSKQWCSDQLWATRGGGASGERHDILRGGTTSLAFQPSQAVNCEHGFASLSRFFPEAKARMAQVEEELWKAAGLYRAEGAPVVFDDQYMSTGGQIYELIMGHDRMLGDVRPLAHQKEGIHGALACHPYDICTALILEESGGLIVNPTGQPVNLPLDTTSPVSWLGFANAKLAETMMPLLLEILERNFNLGKQ